jgi:signal transduction histidine kinase
VKRSPHLFGRSTRWASDHPFAVDVLFALMIGGFTVAGMLSADAEASQRDANWWGVLLIALQTTAFTFRRRAPLASVVALAVPVITFWIADFATNFDAFSLLGVYAATAHSRRSRRFAWSVVGAVVGVLTVVALLGVLSPDEDIPAVAVLGIAVIHLTAAIMGEVMHERRQRLIELEERAARAEAERELLAREAVLRERASIARDLHDVVAHGMSVMVVQAGAAQRLVATQPERAAAALEQIQTTGREALTEMRRLLGVLRNDDSDAALLPQPTLDDLGAMVQRCIEAGVPTDLTVEGTPAGRAAGAEMTAYRIVQEALTNVIKHAGRPVRAAVRVTFTGDQVRLEVDDDGRGARSADLVHSTGHGLVGMRERVELYHGTVHIGPRPGGGFRVSATIPLHAHASTPPVAGVAGLAG